MAGIYTKIIGLKQHYGLLLRVGLGALIVVAAGLVSLAILRPDTPAISSDQVAGCAWSTSCWQQDYLDEFTRDGLIAGQGSEGSLLGFLSYRVQAITTQDVFALVSILFSVLVFLAGLQFGYYQQRRAHTVETILGIFMSDSLAHANSHVADINRRVLTGKISLDGSVTGEDDAALVTILDFYEFLCQSAYEGSLSKKAIREIRGGAMKTTLENCAQYIADRRAILNRPRLYWAYEKFVKNYVRDGAY